MDMENFEREHEKVLKDNGFCRKVSLVLAGSTLILSMGLVFKNDVITINPPEMHEAYQITANKADEAYQKAWALSTAKLIGNMSRNEAPYLIKQLSAMLTPEVYNTVRKALYAHVEMIEAKKISTTFTVKEMYFEKKTQKIFVHGTMELDSLVSKDKERIPFTFEFKVKISNYQPAISHLDFYQGKPRAEGVNFDRNVVDKEKEGANGA